jgi:GNAT superfamily N-acetyltransferase
VSGPRVFPVASRRDRERFIGFPYGCYARDPLWAPPLRRDVRAQLSPEKNPFFRHAEAAHFLAEWDGNIVGRISAIENRAHNAFHGDHAGFFGFFETIDDATVAGALFEQAAAWLAARGLDAMRGPVSPSTNDECGLLVEGFDTPAALMMPHNPPFYAALVERAGLRKAKDLLAYRRAADELPERLVAAADVLARRRAIAVRPIDMRRFDEEIGRVKALYNRAWERNWGFVPMDGAEIDFLAAQLKPVVVPELVVFAEVDGEPIGLAVALPDLNVALRRNPSGRLFPGIVKVALAARRIDRLRVFMLGTLPEWRGKGVDALLYKAIWDAARRKGYRWAEAGWVLEDNHAMGNALVNMGFEAYKRYRIYEREIRGAGTQ